MDFPQIFSDVISYQLYRYDPLPKTKATFKALVDAIVPNESIGTEGSFDSHTDEYVMWMLDHLNSLTIVTKEIYIPLANPTAEVLSIAAKELIARGDNADAVTLTMLKEQGFFAALSPSDRLRTISLLENLDIDLKKLPLPFWNSSAFVLAIISSLPLLAIFGYYSEWSANGSTRLRMPGNRKREDFPASWHSVGYPGISKGYRALRGYLLDEPCER